MCNLRFDNGSWKQFIDLNHWFMVHSRFVLFDKVSFYYKKKTTIGIQGLYESVDLIMFGNIQFLTEK